MEYVNAMISLLVDDGLIMIFSKNNNIKVWRKILWQKIILIFIAYFSW